MPLPATCRVGSFEPPHRHNPYGTGISYTFTTATGDHMLRFEMDVKPLQDGHCGVVAGRNPATRRCMA
jgi:hypothetical protein